MSLGFTIENSNIFNAIFAPVAKKIAVELQKKGVHIFYADQHTQQNSPRLVFGSHSNPIFWRQNKKISDIFVNFEPIYLKEWVKNNDQYIELLKSSLVLDYTSKSKNLINAVDFLPLPPFYDSKELISKKVDVLFVGSMNDRRKKIFTNLINEGINILFKFKIFGQDLYNNIEETKIFLDINTDEDYVFNIYRFALCANTNTLYVGETGDFSDYPEVGNLLGVTLTRNKNNLSRIIKRITSDEGYRLNALKTQRKIAKILEKKFQGFVNNLSKEFV